tara:strand:+ start:295 stop:513 length:219 start_codon:yes stop_codon:yes gene_type:complete
MSLKRLAQLSHFITMMFGVALGMTLSILYQHMVKIIITDLSLIILFIVFFSIIFRAYTLFIWRKENYNLKLE